MPSPTTAARPGSGCWRRAWRGRCSAPCTARSAACRKVNDVAVGIAMMLFGTGVAFFFGKPYIQPTAPRLGSIPFGAFSDNANLRSALDVNPLFFVGIAVALVMAWALAQHALGLDRAHGRRQRRGGARYGHLGRSRALPRRRRSGGFLAGVGGAFLSLSYPGSWNQGLSSGQGLMAVALVIFARWNPLRCVARGAAVWRQPARSARRCNRSASPRAIISSTPPPTSSRSGS